MTSKIRYVSRKTLGPKYQGMNYEAAKALHVKNKPRRDEIYVLDSLSEAEKKRTITHERCEVCHMRHGMDYRHADKLAEKEERK